MRGEKSRFQLFGDTVNTAARIESTGERGKIHLSEDCANLVIEAGKGHWVKPRENKVSAKGKGKLQTYWLDITSSKGSTDSVDLMGQSMNDFGDLGNSLADIGVKGLAAKFEQVEKLNTLSDRTRRQADYTVEVLLKILKRIIAKNKAAGPTSVASEEFKNKKMGSIYRHALSELKEEIPFRSSTNKLAINPETVNLPVDAVREMRDFVATVAQMYRDNPFHSFEHASHVTMSAAKLFSQIESPDNLAGRISLRNMNTPTPSKAASKNMDFGITADPLVEFAIAFSALVHDVDHPGVPNSQLVDEDAYLAKKYDNCSIAEQNSLDSAWNLFTKPSYKNLRACIFPNPEEMKRFRLLVVNLILATDLWDTNLRKRRERLWGKAFRRVKMAAKNDPNPNSTRNLKATAIVEHLIQAADVAHTMQHWNIYLKWNRKLFQEMHEAYKIGRASTNPVEVWFKDELEFFDDFVIPLANKLKDCGVFGDGAEEYLNYAKANRRDWQLKGRDVILEYVSEFKGGGKKKLPTLSAHSSHTAASTSTSSFDDSFSKPLSTPWLAVTSNPSKPSSSSSMRPTSTSKKKVGAKYVSHLNGNK